MFPSVAVILLSLSISAYAVQIRSQNHAFVAAGIQGCIAVAENADGEPLIIHNCNTEDLANQDWEVEFSTVSGSLVGPQQIKVFGDKCIDVKDGVNGDGTKLHIWTCAAGNTNQMWTRVTSDTTFQWSGTNKCIDLTDGKITDGNVLQLWDCDGASQNQLWQGDPNPDTVETVHVIGGNNTPNEGGPWCMVAESNTNGAEVALVACAKTDFFPNGNLTWVVPTVPLTGQFKTFNSKCLDVKDGSTANGAKLQIWDCAVGNTNQLFSMTDINIKWAGSNKCVDLPNFNSSNGNPLQLWDCTNNDLSQNWFATRL
ncbi:hypothetical protein MVEN_00296900 [Mycena venus]|uniref:Ricin B lectin domain-containing protein n=1 Tax=Mycena venus TaxID=2733690 RepID=A0A8H6Z2C8_9AGAR|nr:hypothetical protein MVEN_00296900 [Mycena venus]